MFDYPWQFERQQWTPATSAKRFEAGSPNTMGQAALHASAGLLLDFGMSHVGNRVLNTTANLHRELTRSGVSTVMRGDSIRLSPHFYQGEKQLGAFAEILEQLLATTR